MAGGRLTSASGLEGKQRALRIVGKPQRPRAGHYKGAVAISRRGGGGAEAAWSSGGARKPRAMEENVFHSSSQLSDAGTQTAAEAEPPSGRKSATRGSSASACREKYQRLLERLKNSSLRPTASKNMAALCEGGACEECLFVCLDVTNFSSNVSAADLLVYVSSLAASF